MKIISILADKLTSWADANAFHCKNHGTHQEHLDDVHRRCHARPLKEAVHEVADELGLSLTDAQQAPEDNSWVQVMLVSGWIGVALVVLCAIIG